MSAWKSLIRYDPIPPLIGSDNPALIHAARRDLLDEDVGSPRQLWSLKQVQSLLNKQRPDGAWRYPGGGKQHLRTAEDYDQIETFRVLGELVEKYNGEKALPAVRRAAGYLFTRQTEEGDFRGIYGRQYSPNYTAAIMELLIKAGFARDRRIRKGFRWLLSIRQEDGGWAIPLTTVRARWDVATLSGSTLKPDTTRPFSHMVTGVVLRAFAAHPEQRHNPGAGKAAELLAGRLFKKDTYPGRDKPEFWTRFSYPFWFTDLVSALDSLSRLGYGMDRPEIQLAVKWLADRQQRNGTWPLHILRSGGDKDAGLWVGLAICRVLKRVYSGAA